MPDRRPLDFATTDAILADVDRLLRGHTTSGKWTLGQILGHLQKTIRLSTRQPGGPDPLPAPTPEQDAARAAFFAARSITEGRDLPTPLIAPDDDADPVAEAQSLRKAIERLDAHEGNFPAHPRLGPLTRDQWRQFHCVHCAHHLSFARPA